MKQTGFESTLRVYAQLDSIWALLICKRWDVPSFCSRISNKTAINIAFDKRLIVAEVITEKNVSSHTVHSTIVLDILH